MKLTGCQLKRARENVGLSATEMARLLGTDIANISKQEGGEKPITKEIILGYKMITDLSIKQLIKDKFHGMVEAISERAKGLISELEEFAKSDYKAENVLEVFKDVLSRLSCLKDASEDDHKSNSFTAISVAPTHRGFGFVVYKNIAPAEVLQFGMPRLDRHPISEYVDRLQAFIEFYNPKVMLLLEPIGHRSQSDRITEACEAIKKMAIEKGLVVHFYSQKELQLFFATKGIGTKLQRAINLVERFPMLKRYKPKDERVFIKSHYWTPLFDSFAIMLTHEDNETSEGLGALWE